MLSHSRRDVARARSGWFYSHHSGGAMTDENHEITISATFF
jgi:hypothetical protein